MVPRPALLDSPKLAAHSWCRIQTDCDGLEVRIIAINAHPLAQFGVNRADRSPDRPLPGIGTGLAKNHGFECAFRKDGDGRSVAKYRLHR
jgi:hypothetical protein